jgi:glycogen operon protein
MNGRSIRARDLYGTRLVDDSFMVVFNASELDLDWHLPDERWADRWVVVLDSADPGVGTPEQPSIHVAAGAPIPVTNRSVLLLRTTETWPTATHPAVRSSRLR